MLWSDVNIHTHIYIYIYIVDVGLVHEHTYALATRSAFANLDSNKHIDSQASSVLALDPHQHQQCEPWPQRITTASDQKQWMKKLRIEALFKKSGEPCSM